MSFIRDINSDLDAGQFLYFSHENLRTLVNKKNYEWLCVSDGKLVAFSGFFKKFIFLIKNIFYGETLKVHHCAVQLFNDLYKESQKPYGDVIELVQTRFQKLNFEEKEQFKSFAVSENFLNQQISLLFAPQDKSLFFDPMISKIRSLSFRKLVNVPFRKGYSFSNWNDTAMREAVGSLYKDKHAFMQRSDKLLRMNQEAWEDKFRKDIVQKKIGSCMGQYMALLNLIKKEPQASWIQLAIRARKINCFVLQFLDTLRRQAEREIIFFTDQVPQELENYSNKIKDHKAQCNKEECAAQKENIQLYGKKYVTRKEIREIMKKCPDHLKKLIRAEMDCVYDYQQPFIEELQDIVKEYEGSEEPPPERSIEINFSQVINEPNTIAKALESLNLGDSVVFGISFLHKEESGHIFLGQMSHGLYRFYDPLSSNMGFYEFPNRESFYAGLLRHLKTHYFENPDINYREHRFTLQVDSL